MRSTSRDRGPWATRLMLVISAAVLPAACHLVFPFSNAEPDAAAVRDGRSGARDVLGPPRGDLAASDASRADSSGDADAVAVAELSVAADHGRPDLRRPADGAGAPDSAVPDRATAPRDARAPDVAQPADAAVPKDLPAADQGSSTAPGCAAGQLSVAVDSSMVFCSSGSASSSPQCQAEGHCNVAAGWRLCTATQYLLRFRSTPPPVKDAWIASCVREGLVFAPTDSACSGCNWGNAAVELYNYGCAGGGQGSSAKYVGVKSWDSCMRPGVDTPAAQGYWTAWPTPGGISSAVCCRP